MNKRIRKAVFPVAGLGTRVLPATKVIPKEMLTVVDRPVLQHCVEEAREAGIEHFVFVTGRNKAVIERARGDRPRVAHHGLRRRVAGPLRRPSRPANPGIAPPAFLNRPTAPTGAIGLGSPDRSDVVRPARRTLYGPLDPERMPASTRDTDSAGDLAALADAPRPRLTVRTTLVALVAACLVPAVLGLAIMVVVDYRAQESAVRNEAVMRARTMLLLLDGDLEGIESGLRVLASSNSLAGGELVRFRDRLRTVQKTEQIESYVLVDAEGRLRVDTRAVQSGGSVAAQLRPVFATGKPSLSGAYQRPNDDGWGVALGVPVLGSDGVAFALAVTLTSQQVLASTKAALPDGWVASVIDSGGRIVARTRDAGRFVGQPATPSLLTAIDGRTEGSTEAMTKDGQTVITAFSRSARSGWTIAVGAPRDLLHASLSRSIAILVACGSLVIALALVFAWRVSRLVTQAVGSLIEPALALGAGRPIDLPPTPLRETDEVGRAIRQASLKLARAQHHAYHDPLTNLRNRTLFDEMATRQIVQAYRDGAQLAILAIDLDGFKAVNDQHGHAAGDVVLKRVADRITSSIRGSDVVSRRGGDEFSVLLVDVDGIKTRHIAEKLVVALSMPYPDVDPPVSASIGVARYPLEASTLQELLERADEALYEAKNAGKRRVVGEF